MDVEVPVSDNQRRRNGSLNAERDDKKQGVEEI
jgi:hypothetical protein